MHRDAPRLVVMPRLASETMEPAKLESVVQIWCEVVTFLTFATVEVCLSIAGAWHTAFRF